MLDSSRRLRVDDRKRTLPLHRACGRIGSDAERIAADGRPPIDLSAKLGVPNLDQVERPVAELPRESAQIVYCGTEQQVREGFAIALRAMGIETEFLSGTFRPPAISPNREEN
jgi:hypothetical protein